jgi:hypothetical protein
VPAGGASIYVPVEKRVDLPPSVVRIEPGHDRLVPPGPATIRVVFDQPMDLKAADLRLEPPLRATFHGDDEENAARLDLEEPLVSGTRYSLVVEGTAKARTGLPLGTTVRTHFECNVPQASLSPLGTYVMDGHLDDNIPALSNNGEMRLHASYDPESGALYVAATDAGEGNDHFIFVTDAPIHTDLPAAPWSKQGRVASNGPFMSDENDNEFSAWRNVTSPATAVTGENGGVMEGVLNVRMEFGTDVKQLYLAVGAYGTGERGRLVLGLQVPPAVRPNSDIEAEEFLPFPLETR